MNRKDYSAIKQQYPSIENLDWEKAFKEDVELFGRVLRDVIRHTGERNGRPGPRPVLEPKDASEKLRQILEEDYTLLPLREVVPILSRQASIRKLAIATGLDRNLVHKIMSGRIMPDDYEIRAFAKAFNKPPAFFLEYRIGYVLSGLHAHMEKYPESSIRAYTLARDGVTGVS